MEMKSAAATEKEVAEDDHDEHVGTVDEDKWCEDCRCYQDER